jgi:glycosyltransferase 2 family protein
LATILPITLGGVGIRELVFIKAAEISEIEQDTAVALSVLFFGITVISALAGSIVKLDVQPPTVESTKVSE